MLTPIGYVALHFRDSRGAFLLRLRNRAEITVLMSKQKPFLVWFLCGATAIQCNVYVLRTYPRHSINLQLVRWLS